MFDEFDENDEVSDLEDWECRLRAAGVYEREQERKAILSKLTMSQLTTNADDSDEALTSEEWLGKTVTFPECNYSSYSLAHLRQLDRWLWEYEPIPFTKNSVTSYLFVWNDVVRARTTGKVTTQEQWQQLVDQRYYACWLKYNVGYLQDMLDWYMESDRENSFPSDQTSELSNPDKYTHWRSWTGKPILWKAIARFPMDSAPGVVTTETSNADPSAFVSKGAYGKWYVHVPHEQGSISLGEWYEKDDALACAIEGLRCLQPNASFSEAELAHSAATMDRREMEMAVAGLIGRWFYTHGRNTFPARVEAILALDTLYRKDGQFERDSEGVWQLWCEADDPIASTLVSRAVAVSKEVSEALDRTWGEFISPRLDDRNYRDVETG